MTTLLGRGKKVFLLDGNQLFTWYNIFLVIGLDKSFPFLFDVDFPLHSHYREIQHISQDFVKKVFDNELKLFEINKPSPLSETLFQEVYALLTLQIGEENTKSFCKWGNELNRDTKKKLLKFWSRLRDESRIDTDNHPNDLKILPLRMLINRYNHYLRGVYNTIDDVEKIPRNEWEELAYTLYHRIGDSEKNLNAPVDISPLDFFEGVITYCSLLNLLIQLQTIPEIENLLARLGLDEAYSEINQLLA